MTSQGHRASRVGTRLTTDKWREHTELEGTNIVQVYAVCIMGGEQHKAIKLFSGCV